MKVKLNKNQKENIISFCLIGGVILLVVKLVFILIAPGGETIDLGYETCSQWVRHDNGTIEPSACTRAIEYVGGNSVFSGVGLPAFGLYFMSIFLRWRWKL